MYFCIGEGKTSVIFFSQKAEWDHFRKSFHSFCEEQKMEGMPRKKLDAGKRATEPFCEEISLPGLLMGLAGESLAGGWKQGPFEPTDKMDQPFSYGRWSAVHCNLIIIFLLLCKQSLQYFFSNTERKVEQQQKARLGEGVSEELMKAHDEAQWRAFCLSIYLTCASKFLRPLFPKNPAHHLMHTTSCRSEIPITYRKQNDET